MVAGGHGTGNRWCKRRPEIHPHALPVHLLVERGFPSLPNYFTPKLSLLAATPACV